MKMTKKTAILSLAAACALAVFGAVLAQTQPAVTVADVTAAGYTDVKAVPPAGDRFDPPVLYFRVSPAIGDNDAKLDCADCRDLLAAYVGQVKETPTWAINQKNPVYKIGGRIQIRLYASGTKRVIIVTGPDQQRLANLATALMKKYGQ